MRGVCVNVCVSAVCVSDYIYTIAYTRAQSPEAGGGGVLRAGLCVCVSVLFVYARVYPSTYIQVRIPVHIPYINTAPEHVTQFSRFLPLEENLEDV